MRCLRRKIQKRRAAIAMRTMGPITTPAIQALLEEVGLGGIVVVAAGGGVVVVELEVVVVDGMVGVEEEVRNVDVVEAATVGGVTNKLTAPSLHPIHKVGYGSPKDSNK